jgi:hypothetical protein
MVNFFLIEIDLFCFYHFVQQPAICFGLELIHQLAPHCFGNSFIFHVQLTGTHLQQKRHHLLFNPILFRVCIGYVGSNSVKLNATWPVIRFSQHCFENDTSGLRIIVLLNVVCYYVFANACSMFDCILQI